MKVHRFYYVGSHRASAKIHRAETTIEGNLTFCGRPMRLGWGFWLGIARVPKNRALCSGCCE